MEINKKTTKQILFIVAISILMLWAALNLTVIGSWIGKIISVLTPFIIGFCIAFVVNLLMKPFESLLKKIFKKQEKFYKKIKRPVSLTLSMIIVLGVIFAVMFVVIPEVSRTLITIAEKLPEYFEGLKGKWASLSKTLEKFSITLPEFSGETGIFSKLTSWLTNIGERLVDQTIKTTTAVFGAVVDIFIGFVFSVYLLASKEKLGRQLRKLAVAFMNKNKAESLFSFTDKVKKTFTNFITGQVLEAIILATLCFIGMTIFKMPYAYVIAILIGIMALIPIFGALIGTAIGAFLILVDSPIKALWFVVFIIILQQIEGNLIYPHVVGKSVGLPGIWVLVAVTVGGNLFGVLGMLLGVPICSIVYFSLAEFVSTQLNSRTKEKNAEKK